MPAPRLRTLVLLAALLVGALGVLAPPAEAAPAGATAAEPARTSERLRDLVFRLEHELRALQHEIRTLRLRVDDLGETLGE